MSDEPTSTITGPGMNGALEFLVQREFFTAGDLKDAHEMIFNGLSLSMPEGPSSSPW